MVRWIEEDRGAITPPDALAMHLQIGGDELEAMAEVCERFPMKITPYYAGLIEKDDPRDPLRLIAVPRIEELTVTSDEIPDPIGDANQELRTRPVAAVTHRYPERVLLHVTPLCGGHCRHCFRRRTAGRERSRPGDAALEAAFDYISGNREVREVILTGGDPLMEPDERLLQTVERIRLIDHIRTIRIHTRMPVWNPYRLTDELASGLAKHHPLWIVTHFNHPRELTELAVERLAGFIDRGLMVLNQSVLLRGVNDSAGIQRELLWALVQARVKPYYLHHPDKALGTSHFRVSLRRGVAILRELRGTVPGYAIPHYVLDIPSGYGKVPLQHRYVRSDGNGGLVVESPDGRLIPYREHGREHAAPSPLKCLLKGHRIPIEARRDP